jgi:hypothetical protein
MTHLDIFVLHRITNLRFPTKNIENYKEKCGAQEGFAVVARKKKKRTRTQSPESARRDAHFEESRRSHGC